MSSNADPAGGPAAQPETQASLQAMLDIDADEWARIETAAGAVDEDAEAFVLDATRQRLVEVLEEDDPLACPHEDCTETFATQAQRRGHLGGVHSGEMPTGDYWCGYCGDGPYNWQGVGTHHGQVDHDGDPIRRDQEPDQSDLEGAADQPDHRDPELLAELYEEHDGSYSEMCRAHDFGVAPGTVRRWLIKFDIHDVTPHRNSDREYGNTPKFRDEDWLQEQYEAANGNVSAMHREMDADIPYRTLLNNLKAFDIHDPANPPARTPPSDPDDADDEDEPDQDEPEPVPVAKEETNEPPAPGTAEWGDLDTPAWLDEGSFFSAIDYADTVIELKDALGWDDLDRITDLVDALGLADELEGYQLGDGR